MNDEIDDDFEFAEDVVVSKSQKKREMHQLLELAEKALVLPDEKLEKMGFDDKVIVAFRDARKLKASGARNRQLKYITKLINRLDTGELEKFVLDMENDKLNEARKFHQLESWRDRIIHDGDKAINDFLNIYPDADRQQLRTLSRQAQKEADTGKTPVAARKLFKFIKSFSG